MADQNKIVYNIKVNAEQGTATIRDLKGQIVATQVPVDQLRGKFGNFAKQVNAVKFDKFNKGLKSATSANKELAGASGGATTSVLELGRVVSDAPYGIRGMANNVSQLASNMLFTSQQIDKTTGKVIGLGGVLKDMGKVFLGPLGLLFLIQGAIALLDGFAGGATKAKKSTQELTKEVYANGLVMRGYVDELEDVSISEERRKVVVQELTEAIPTLTAAELEYGNNLDNVRLKIKQYTLAQAARIEMDKLVQENSELLSQQMKVDLINSTEDQEEKIKLIKGLFIDAGIETQKLVQQSYSMGQKSMTLRDKTNKELITDFKELAKGIKEESDPIMERIERLSQGLAFDPKKGKGKGKVKEKKLSPFKTPKELDIDIKNAENAIIQYEKKIEDARLKEEFNEKMSTAKTEEEKEKIRRTYQKDRLLNQIKAEKLALELKKKTEIENVKLKTSNHKADLKRIYDKYIFELSLNKKLSDEEKKKLKDEATGKFGIANIQATGEENISIQEITDKYTPLFSLFQKLSDARLSALFSMPSKEGKRDDKANEYDLEAGLNSYMELQQGLTSFMDGEFSRQITLEQNKTNAINNELKERLNNENLSAGERKNIQLQIARNDEALRKKQEKIEKKRFRMQKAANISQALIETYLAAAKALKTFGGVPTGLPAMSATIATGLLNVATIARQKFQSSAGATVPAGALGSGGSGGADRSFNFNLAGASQENQLAQTLQSQFDQPIQTYVVARDITNQQQLDQDILSNASFG